MLLVLQADELLQLSPGHTTVVKRRAFALLTAGCPLRMGVGFSISVTQWLFHSGAYVDLVECVHVRVFTLSARVLVVAGLAHLLTSRLRETPGMSHRISA